MKVLVSERLSMSLNHSGNEMIKKICRQPSESGHVDRYFENFNMQDKTSPRRNGCKPWMIRELPFPVKSISLIHKGSVSINLPF